MTTNRRIAAVFLVLAFILGTLWVAGYFSNGHASVLPASQVAKSLGCSDFQNTNPGHAGSIDAGHCLLNGKLYAINTFPSKDVRDDWMAAATAFGVRPAYLTDTSVTYPSIP